MRAGLHMPPEGAVSLSALLDEAVRQWDPTMDKGTVTDAFLFSGNRHESVPRALFLDRRLTPLERNAWQVFRFLLNPDGLTAFPTYEQMRPYLASMPCASSASYETVARALTLLRLTRWLSLVRRRRDTRTGRLQGNVYVLHDEPLTPFEVMQLDHEYLRLVSQALGHASKAIQRVGVHVLREMADDPLLADRTLPTRLQVLLRRLDGDAGQAAINRCSQEARSQPSEEGESNPLRQEGTLSSESEVGRKSAQDVPLRNPKKDRTVRMECIKDVRTVPRARGELSLPERFYTLRPEQQKGVLAALQSVDRQWHQAILDEWDARCRAHTVRSPAGYLFGIVQKAIRGEFHARAGQVETGVSKPPASISISSSPPARTRADPATAKAHIEQLRRMLRLG